MVAVGFQHLVEHCQHSLYGDGTDIHIIGSVNLEENFNWHLDQWHVKNFTIILALRRSFPSTILNKCLPSAISSVTE